MEGMMGRYLVPALVLAAVSGLAFVLIGVIVSRSPYTHANLSLTPSGYTRTSLSFVGQEEAFLGLGLDRLPRPVADNPEEAGRYLFIVAGCALCHGLHGSGGPAAPSLLKATKPEIVKAFVRSGPGGMPAYPPQVLSDEDLANITAYLQSLAGGRKAGLAGQKAAEQSSEEER